MEVEKLEEPGTALLNLILFLDGFSGGKSLHWVLGGNDNLHFFFDVKMCAHQMYDRASDETFMR